MTRLRFNRRLSAAAAGLLGFAFLRGAVAFADSYEIIPDPNSTETITSLYGLEATPPSVPDTIQGYQLFDYVDTTTGKTVGTFDAYEAYNPNVYFHRTEELLVYSDVSGDSGIGTGQVPPAGSVFDIIEKANSEQVYSDLASPSGDHASEVRETPRRDHSLPNRFDASKGLADKTVDHHTIALPNGNSILPESGSPENFTAISGYPPSDVAVQGEQVFTVDGPDGSPVGSFDADVTTTQDIFGNYTEAIVVTQDLSGTPGTAAGDVLNPGSVLNIFYYPTGGTSLYIDLTSPSGEDVISDVSTNARGQVSTSDPTFEASNSLTTRDITLPADGDKIVPVSSLEVAGINGLPPTHVDIQGYQQFEIEDSSGNPVGTFDADVNNYAYATGKYGETLLVTQDLSGTPGTGAGDVPQLGSTFDIAINGNKEIIYSDLTSPSGDNISKYVVHPYGHYPEYTRTDLSAGLFHGSFYVPADLTSSVDPSVLSGADPSAAVGFEPSAALGTLLDAFPHLDGALETLINLF